MVSSGFGLYEIERATEAVLFLALPGPVAAAYLLVMIAVLFSLGMRIAVQDGMDFRKAAIVGVAFWIGTGFQHSIFFSEGLDGCVGGLLGNGMASGGLAARAPIPSSTRFRCACFGTSLRQCAIGNTRTPIYSR